MTLRPVTNRAPRPRSLAAKRVDSETRADLDLLPLDDAMQRLWEQFGFGSCEAQDYYDYRMASVPDE